MHPIKTLPSLLIALLLSLSFASSSSAGGSNGWLGVMIGQQDGGAIEVFSVFDDSPAADAGLRKGDVIVAVDGVRLESDDASALKETLGSSEAGDRVRLRVVRDGKERTVRVRLGEKPQDIHVQARGKREAHERSLREHEGQLREHRGALREHQKALREHEASLRLHERHFRETEKARARPRLGVAVETLTGQLASYFHTEPGHLLIREVIANSAAAEAGLLSGDVLLRVEGREVGTLAELRKALDRYEDGDSVELEVLRKGSPHAFDVVLGQPGEGRSSSRVKGRHSRSR